MNVPKRFSPPGADFWFGTDHLGRDVFSRVVHGAAFSLTIGGLTILLAGVPGIFVGILAAAAPPRPAGLLMRALDVLMSFPALLLAVAVGAALGTGGRSIVIALAVVYFPRIARMTRGIALSVMTQEYVTASRALGTSIQRLLLRTVVPNCLSVVIVQCSLYFAEVLLAEAALSFLGLGRGAAPADVGQHALRGAEEHAERPMAGDLPGRRDRGVGVRAEPLRRRGPGRDGPAPQDLIARASAAQAPVRLRRAAGVGLLLVEVGSSGCPSPATASRRGR